MDKSLCKLTLVCPPDAIDNIIELMLSRDPPMPGFTTWEAEGHSFGFSGTTVNERVRGRVKRHLISAVLERAEADDILEAIAQRMPIFHMLFWIEPIERFARLQPLASVNEAIPKKGSKR
jgi:hypothetical protein